MNQERTFGNEKTKQEMPAVPEDFYLCWWIPRAAHHQAYVQICNYLFSSAQQIRIEWSPISERKPVTFESPPDDVEILEFLRRCDQNERWCEFEMRYRMPSGHDVGVTLRYNSVRLGEPQITTGWPSGVIDCRISESCVMQPLEETRLRKEVYSRSKSHSHLEQFDDFLDSVRGQPDCEELGAAIAATEQNLVSVLLGVIAAVEPYPELRVQHASILCSCEWNSPLRQSTAFHRHLREFSLDFARVFMHTHTDLLSSDTFDAPDQPIWSLKGPDGNSRIVVAPLTERARYACYPCEPTPERHSRVLRFFQALDRARAEQLSEVAGDKMLRFLQQAVLQTPRTWLRKVDPGTLIGIHPLSNLREVYIRAAELSGVIPPALETGERSNH